MPRFSKSDFIVHVSENIPKNDDEFTVSSSNIPVKTENTPANSPAALADAKAVHELLILIMAGDPDNVCTVLKKDPDLFFKKGQVTNNDGLTFFNISPYQLLLFLCDADMLGQITEWLLIDKNASNILLEQDNEMNGGGADLVKIDRDPTTLSFDEISMFTDPSEVDRSGKTIEVIYPLLVNKDGIICYRDNFYYVNRDMQKQTIAVKLLHPFAENTQEELGLKALKTSLNDMENNSSRRSSNEEHALIKSTTGLDLEREGIHYEKNGIHYRDTQNNFTLIHTYRTYIRLSKEMASDKEIDEFWIHKIGIAQRHSPMWLLQRLCEDRSFMPLPNFIDTPFVRDNQFWNVVTHRDESIIPTTPDIGLGFDYALFKAGARRPSAIGGAAGGPWGAPPAAARLDLAAIRKIIKIGIMDIAALRTKLLTQANIS